MTTRVTGEFLADGSVGHKHWNLVTFLTHYPLPYDCKLWAEEQVSDHGEESRIMCNNHRHSDRSKPASSESGQNVGSQCKDT